MTTDRTVLLLKDKSKGIEVSHYRPKTCLPLMWKLITGIVADKIYNILEENDLLPEQQTGCRRNSRGAKDQLLIDKAVMEICRRRKIGLSMVGRSMIWYPTRGLKNPWRCVKLQITYFIIYPRVLKAGK